MVFTIYTNKEMIDNMRTKYDLWDFETAKKHWDKEYKKMAREIKTGQFICRRNVIAANSKEDRSIVDIKYYRITDIKKIDESGIKLLIKADFFSRDFDDIPKRRKLWFFDDLIQFSFVELSENSINQRHPLNY